MKLNRWVLLPIAAPLVLAGCGAFDDAMTEHTDVVAEAAGSQLEVDEAVRLLSQSLQVPADPQVVEALAEIWVDYTLLATAAAADPTLAALDLDAFTRPEREQMVILRLRDRVIRADTVFTEAELQQLWATEGPGAEIRARHILLRVPPEATPAQRDSIRQLAESLRQRAVAGEDFAALATQFSQDPGSAAQGGDLGYFGRGRMVAPFEEVAFALQPGQVSQVVESPFGLHVIRLEDRRQAELGEQREQFRQFMAQRAVQQAEASYLEQVTERAQVQVSPEGPAVLRQIAEGRAEPLEGRAAGRVLATYRGGQLTSGEAADALRGQPAQAYAQLAAGTDEQLTQLTEQLVTQELLLAQAAAQNVALSPAETDTLRNQARQAIRQLLQSSGLATGENNTAAIEARVLALIEGALSGRAQVVPLGRLGQALREEYDAEIHESAFAEVVRALQAIRATQPAPQPGVPQPGVPQPTAPPAP